MTKLFFSTREEWLTAALGEFELMAKDAGYTLPKKVKISCGWPVGSRGGKKVLGQCFSPDASAGHNIEIFVAPTIDDEILVLGVTLHEYVHAIVGNDAKHGPVFAACGAALGLEGPPTRMLPGEDMVRRFKRDLLPTLGKYPHASIDYEARKRQSTRMIKLVCPKSGYTVRTTRKWIDEQGYPTSPAGHKMKEG